jgi:cytochrome P450
MSDDLMSNVNSGEQLRFPSHRKSPFQAPDEYAVAREKGVVPATLFDGRTVWFASRYQDVSEVLMDRRFSSSSTAENFPFFSASRKQVQLAAPYTLNRIDPPEHSSLRRMFAPMFTVQKMALFRPRLQAFVDGLIKEIIEKGPPSTCPGISPCG